jgi:ferrous iron transport protein B
MASARSAAWSVSGCRRALRGLVTDGLLAGLGTVLGFLPQILVLFFFILLLEESGYLPRAAFVLDKLMVSVGLSGRSFIPLLSSFACAIPGIMGTRSITDPRDRLATILVAPLMTCSARLPVYALLIGASSRIVRCWASSTCKGWRCSVSMWRALPPPCWWPGGQAHRPLAPGTGAVDGAALLSLPHWRDIALGLWERGAIFLKRLTGVMLALTVLMWAICTFLGTGGRDPRRHRLFHRRLYRPQPANAVRSARLQLADQPVADPRLRRAGDRRGHAGDRLCGGR